jgi:hypothetical protein
MGFFVGGAGVNSPGPRSFFRWLQFPTILVNFHGLRRFGTLCAILRFLPRRLKEWTEEISCAGARSSDREVGCGCDSTLAGLDFNLEFT